MRDGFLPEGWIEALPGQKLESPSEIGWYALWNCAASTDEDIDVWISLAYWNGICYTQCLFNPLAHAIGRSEQAYKTNDEAARFADQFEDYLT